MPPLDFGNLSSNEQSLPVTRRELPPTERRQPSVKREKSKSRPFVNLADSSEAETDVDSDASVQHVTTKMRVKKEKMTPNEKQRSREKQNKRQSINAGNSSQDDTDDYDSDGNPGPATRKKTELFERLNNDIRHENMMQKLIKRDNEKVKREKVKSEYPAAAAAAASASASSSSSSAAHQELLRRRQDLIERVKREPEQQPMSSAEFWAHNGSNYSPEEIADRQKAEVKEVWARREVMSRLKRDKDAQDRHKAEISAKKARVDAPSSSSAQEAEVNDMRSLFGSAIDRPLYTGAAAFTVGVAQSGSDLARRAADRAMKAYRDTGEAFHAYSSVADFSNIGTAAVIAASIGAVTAVAEASLNTVMPKPIASALVRPMRMVGGAMAAAVAGRATMRMMDQAEQNAYERPYVAAAAASSSDAPSYDSVFGNGQGQRLGGRANPEGRADVLQGNAYQR
jgi:hypothetical protein